MTPEHRKLLDHVVRLSAFVSQLNNLHSRLIKIIESVQRQTTFFNLNDS